MLKLFSSLGFGVEQNQKELFTYMNRVVKQILEKLGFDWSKENIINIPKNFELIDEREVNWKMQS